MKIKLEKIFSKPKEAIIEKPNEDLQEKTFLWDYREETLTCPLCKSEFPYPHRDRERRITFREQFLIECVSEECYITGCRRCMPVTKICALCTVKKIQLRGGITRQLFADSPNLTYPNYPATSGSSSFTGDWIDYNPFGADDDE